MKRLLLVIVFVAGLFADDAPRGPQKAPSATLIKPDTDEQLQFEIIKLQEEILRLTTCLKRNLSIEECGPWRNGQVMQLPKSSSEKPQSTNAEKQQPVETPPDKSANKKIPEKAK